MYLRLEIISSNGAALGESRSKVVGQQGARIGRGKSNDWVIEDPYISREHACVRYLNGAFYVEGLGKNPLAINDPKRVIPNNEPQILRSGDRFFLDQYEIRATVAQGSAPASIEDPFSADDPFPAAPAAGVPATTPRSQGSPLIPQAWEDILPGSSGSPGSAGVDPLAALGVRTIPDEPTLAPVEFQQIDPIHESYQPPAIPRSAAPASAARPSPAGAAPAGRGPAAIPDSWEQSRFVPREPAERGPPQRAATPETAPAGALPEDPLAVLAPERRASPRPAPVQQAAPPSQSDPDPLAALTPERAPDRPAPARWAPPRRAPEPQAPETPPMRSGRAPSGAPAQPESRPAATVVEPYRPTTAVAEPYRPAVAAPAPASPPPAPARVPAAATGAESASLAELLQAAGIPGGQLSPQTAAELGEVLRIVVQGVMEVLQARAEIKSQFRMPATRVQASDNNPLKFSPNVETALHTLLVERNRAYMPTTRAFQDAFTDIRNHQLAILHGIRTAYASMLESFDPERLEETLGGESRRSLLGGKGRFRDQYAEHFRRLAGDPDESFRRLFGEVFAEAYEEQLERLKNTGGPRRA